MKAPIDTGLFNSSTSLTCLLIALIDNWSGFGRNGEWEVELVPGGCPGYRLLGWWWWWWWAKWREMKTNVSNYPQLLATATHHPPQPSPELTISRGDSEPSFRGEGGGTLNDPYFITAIASFYKLSIPVVTNFKHLVWQAPTWTQQQDRQCTICK